MNYSHSPISSHRSQDGDESALTNTLSNSLKKKKPKDCLLHLPTT